MKKRHLYTVLLSVLVVLLLVSPVFAESLISPLPDEKPAEHDGCDHAHTLAESSDAVSMAAKLAVCKHEKELSYLDLDTNEGGYICSFCGRRRVSETVLVASADILTSADIRATCVHNFTSWKYANIAQHSRECITCGHTDTGVHERVPPTCTVDEYCRVCGGRSTTWDERLEHRMVWSYDWEKDSGVHDKYCTRYVAGYDYYCDYVEVDDQPCTLSISWYVEPAVNGIHEIFRECVVCGYLTESLYNECTAHLGACLDCNRLNPYT